MPSTLSDQLEKLIGDLETTLRKHAAIAGSPHRRKAAGQLADRMRRMAEQAPEAPIDPASQQAVDHMLQMLRSAFPFWSLQSSEEEK